MITISSTIRKQWSLTSQQTLCSLVMIQNCQYSSFTILTSSHMTSSSILSQRRSRRNTCLEHQGSQTAVGFKCVHSHPLHAWDAWLWKECGKQGFYVLAVWHWKKSRPYEIQSHLWLKWASYSVWHTFSIHSRCCCSRKEYVGPFVQWEACGGSLG